MRIPRIFVETPITAGQPLTLTGNPANHVGRVLRLQPGNALILFNGDGLDYPATITEVARKEVTVDPETGQDPGTESPLDITLGQVVSRGDRMDYAIQKAVEMGVTRIQPLTSERCEVRLSGDRERKRLHNWQQIANSAAEQCGRARVPQIMALQPLKQWIKAADDERLRLVLHHECQTSLTQQPEPTALDLLIGPEGGLSEHEITQALEAGFTGIALGPRVLRTETAPVATLALCQWLWGDAGTTDQGTD